MPWATRTDKSAGIEAGFRARRHGSPVPKSGRCIPSAEGLMDKRRLRKGFRKRYGALFARFDLRHPQRRNGE